jgi:hypothetical protein
MIAPLGCAAPRRTERNLVTPPGRGGHPSSGMRTSRDGARCPARDGSATKWRPKAPLGSRPMPGGRTARSRAERAAPWLHRLDPRRIHMAARRGLRDSARFPRLAPGSSPVRPAIGARIRQGIRVLAAVGFALWSCLVEASKSWSQPRVVEASPEAISRIGETGGRASMQPCARTRRTLESRHLDELWVRRIVADPIRSRVTCKNSLTLTLTLAPKLRP